MSKHNNEEPARIRRSGLREQPRKNRFSNEEIQNLFLQQESEFDSFKNDYNNLMYSPQKKFAYLVFFHDRPGLFYISFQTYAKRHVSRLVASKYFKKLYRDRPLNQYYWAAQRKRVPEFDKYARTERIPIAELMKQGASFSCSTCGQGLYTYEDIKNENCYVFEGEGEINPFTKGMIICKECRKKFV